MSTRSPKVLQAAAFASLMVLCNGCGGSGGGEATRVEPPKKVPNVSAADSRLAADPVANLLADGLTESTITVNVIDTAGNPVAGYDVVLDVSGSGNRIVQPSAQTDASGRVQGTLASTDAGLKMITALVTTPTGAVTLTQTVQVSFIDPNVPAMQGVARFEDNDRSGSASQGDRLVIGFTLDVDASNASIANFDLPVIGDSFGSGASVQAGAESNEVVIRLGNGAVLRTRGAFAAGNNTINDPSGITLDGASGIVGTSSGAPASAGTIDVVPAFSSQAIALPSTSSHAVAAGDLDRDGDLDLWIARSGADQVMLGDNNLGFTPSNQFGSFDSLDVVIIDFNRFGGEDIAVAQENGIQLWNNTSTAGTLNIQQSTLLPSPNVHILLAMDLNRDGYPELIAAGNNGVQVWEKVRAIGLTFNLAATLGSGAASAIAFGDMDNDGDADLIIAEPGSSPRIYNHDGALAFTTGEELAMNRDATDLAIADVDNDGDLDVLAAATGNAVLFRNNGSSFSPETSDITAERVRFADLDGDGKQDVVTSLGSEVHEYINDGSGSFASTGARLTEDGAIRATMLVDLDREGDLDLATVVDNRVAIRNGSLTGTWGTATYSETAALGTEDTLATALGDFDGDGLVDMVSANSGPDLVLFSDGNGSFKFSGRPEHTLSVDVTSSLVIGDVDGDGDLDIITGAPAAVATSNTVWINNGNGEFQAAFSFGGILDALALVLGDIDGDRDLDLIVGNAGANQVWRNDSTGGIITFTLRTNQMPADPINNNQQTNALVLIDMDHDGDLDLVVANGELTSGQQNKYHSNNGNGTMTFLRNLPGGAESTFSLAVADLDGDQYMDVALGNRGNGGTIKNRVVEGLANGKFAFQVRSFADGPHDTRGLAAVDVDGDGDIDLLAGDIGTRSFRSWLNDGDANFTIGDRIGNHNSSGLATADLDNDGDVDAVVPNRNGQPNRVYLNH